MATHLACMKSALTAGRVRPQSNVRHIVTGFFLGAGASKAAEEADERPTNWQATQHSNRYRVR